jgi:hypothetical protein
MVAMGHGLCVYFGECRETTKNKEESKIVNVPQYPSSLCRLKWAVTHVISLHVELTILGEYDVASMTI